MRFEPYTSLFFYPDKKKIQLKIEPLKQIGLETGNVGDGPKALVVVEDISRPSEPIDPMVLKIIAPRDTVGLRNLSSILPSRVLRKWRSLKEPGVNMVDTILRDKDNSSLLMSDLTQGGNVQLVDFVTINSMLINNPYYHEKVDILAPWFLTSIENILHKALKEAQKASKAGYTFDFDTYFALRDPRIPQEKIVAGDLGHGVFKIDANEDTLFKASMAALWDRFVYKLKLVNNNQWDNLQP